MSYINIPRITHKSWSAHVAKLSLALPQNATPAEAIAAGRRCGWGPEFTRQVLAAGDGEKLIYHPKQNVWRKVA